MTQQFLSASSPPHPTGQRQWVALVALVLGALGFVLCVVALGAMIVEFRLSGHWLPAVTLSDYWGLIYITGAGIGVCSALVGLGLGLVLVLWSKGNRQRRRRGAWALALGVAALALVGFGNWYLDHPPYFTYGLHPPSAAEQIRLAALGPEAVVRTYYESRDLSIEYWLGSDEWRAVWHMSNGGPDVSLVAGVDRLRITPLNDKQHPAKTNVRYFRVTYSTRVEDVIGYAPGPQDDIVRVARKAGGPWRLT